MHLMYLDKCIQATTQNKSRENVSIDSTLKPQEIYLFLKAEFIKIINLLIFFSTRIILHNKLMIRK